MNKIREILEEVVDLDYYLTQDFVDKIIIKKKNNSKTGEIGYIEKGTGQHQSNTIYDWNYLARTIQASDYKAPLKIICDVKKGAGVLKLNDTMYSVRKITPLECWRLQGFKDEDYYKVEPFLSKTKLYERAGRGICVPMLQDIFKNFIPKDEHIKLFESFSGVGSQRMALENEGFNFESVGTMEVDKWGIIAYDKIHNNQLELKKYPKKEDMIDEMKKRNIAYNFSTYKDEMPRSENEVKILYKAHKNSNNYGDITRINPSELPDMNFFTYSFPCKNISVAGNQKGMEKDSGTQSSLVWECEKIIKEKLPKYLMMENVKNICGKDNIKFFQEWIDLLNSYGYESEWKVYNACDYGVPQNRERVIMMSKLKEENKDKNTKENIQNNLIIIGNYREDLFYMDLLYNSIIYCNDEIWIEKLSELNIDTLPIYKSTFTDDFKFNCILTTKEAQDKIKPYKDNIQSMLTYDFRVNPPKLWKKII